MNRLLAICLAVITLALPARANPYADMVQMRLVPGWRTDDGTLIAGLEFDLAPGWKTYWRAPGDAGVPPVFDWSASRNLAGLTVNWPAPQVFAQNGLRTIGYENRVVLPLSIAPRRDVRPVTLRGTIDIGICSDICVPIRLTLDETLDTPGTRPVPEIAAALAERPFSAAEAGLTSRDCSIAPTADGLSLRAAFTLPSTGGQELAVVETGDPMIWASEPRITRQGNTLIAEFDLLHATGGPFALDRSALRFTILGKKHAVDVQGCNN